MSTSARWRTAISSPGGSIEGLPAELARAKALAASALRPEAYCLGADQTLTVGTRLLHKARDRAEAAEIAGGARRTRASADLRLLRRAPGAALVVD